MPDAQLSNDEIDSLLGGIEGTAEEDTSDNSLDNLLSDNSNDAESISSDEMSSLLGGVGETPTAPANPLETLTTGAQDVTKDSSETLKNLPAFQSENLLALQEVPIDVVVELGRTIKMVKEILSIGEGSIIELDKAATEPVDLLVNNKVIGKGEVVVVDENFGVRITKMLNQQ